MTIVANISVRPGLVLVYHYIHLLARSGDVSVSYLVVTGLRIF